MRNNKNNFETIAIIYLAGSVMAITIVFLVDEAFRSRHIQPAIGGDIFLVVASFALSIFAVYTIYRARKE